MDICVIGAGVIGLTTALEIKKEFPSANCVIIADKFQQDTTSSVAAGIFKPSTSSTGPTPEITQKWINDSYEHWENLSKSSDAINAGVTEISGYVFSSYDESIVRNHYMEKLVASYRRATETELELCPGNWKYGSVFTTLKTECNLYLPWAINKFKSMGGVIIPKTIENFQDLSAKTTENYDYIVNCTGLGAKKLCGDSKLIPMRGQIINVSAPWIKTAFFGDTDTYIIPGFMRDNITGNFTSYVTLGGCRQYGSTNLNVCPYDTMAIRERCENLLPSLRGSPILQELVGLRPHRDTVRVELEFSKHLDGSRMKIIHNYGHGGFGVTIAPGTSKQAVNLIKDCQSMSGSEL